MAGTLNPHQKKILKRYVTEFGGEDSISELELARLRVLACVEWEMDMLQSFINKHGPTYQVIGKSGDTYSRARPEYQQLQECRQRHGVLLDKLNNDNTNANDTTAYIAL